MATSIDLSPLQGTTLRRGDTGSKVTLLQQALIALGYNLGDYGEGGVDGKFGPATEKAVKAFQKAKGISVDGIVGSVTLSKLQAALPSASGNGVASSSASSNKAIVKDIAEVTGSPGEVFVTWEWTKSNTDNYELRWYYNTGDGVWFTGNESTTTYQNSTYSVPDNAVSVKFKVRPIAKTRQVTFGNATKDEPYWTAEWSTEKTFVRTSLKPGEVSAPSDVTLATRYDSNGQPIYDLTASLDNLNPTELNANGIEFQVVKDDKYGTDGSVYTSKPTITTGHVEMRYRNIEIGHVYKVRCRAIKTSGTKIIAYGEWSDYSSNVETPLNAPERITVLKFEKKNGEVKIYIRWAPISAATSYVIEYTNDERYFTQPGDNTITSITHEAPTCEHWISPSDNNNFGNEYFFRVKAVKDSLESVWCPVRSLVVGERPQAPTTWSSVSSAIVNDDFTLNWTHNSEDGSTQKYVEIELKFFYKQETATISINDSSVDDENKTTSYPINAAFTANGHNYAYYFGNGEELRWRVRTAGVMEDSAGNPLYSDWSIERTVKVSAKPTLDLTLQDQNGTELAPDIYGRQVVTELPFIFSAVPGPANQSPIGYQVSIYPREGPIVSSEAIYSSFFSVSANLSVTLTALDLKLENNQGYTISCTVSMDSGLATTTNKNFTVLWSDDPEIPQPNAYVTVDPDTLRAYILPYCSGYVVDFDAFMGVEDTTEDGSMDEAFLNDPANYNEILISNVVLSVYRVNLDGSIVEIAANISNTKTERVIDPHPNLGTCTYRIIATSQVTSKSNYADLDISINEPAIVITWNEVWTNTMETELSTDVEPWIGSMVKLPYNVDISDNLTPDVSFVNYIGREHSVSYYGTHLGHKASWNTDIAKSDTETINRLRKLSRFMGDVYVRDPYGNGYWASVTVQFPINHLKMTVPVTLEITRVEGGV